MPWVVEFVRGQFGTENHTPTPFLNAPVNGASGPENLYGYILLFGMFSIRMRQ
jgi:hypothetical protein